MRNFFRCLGLVVLTLPVLAAEVFADLCPPQFDAIFVGRVTGLARAGAPTLAEKAAPLVGISGQHARVWFVIERSYRGIDPKRRVIAVETQAGVGKAAYDFKMGEHYLVYADGSSKMKSLDYSTLVVGSDSPSKLATEAAPEIRSLEGFREIGGSPIVPMVSGRAISMPQPQYPPAAKEARVSGVVYIKLLIDEIGQVAQAKVLCGHPLLAEAALKAAWLARFTPVIRREKPTRYETLATYNFVLQ